MNLEIASRELGVEAHVHVVFPQDPIADDGRHGRARGASVFGAYKGPGPPVPALSASRNREFYGGLFR